MSLTDIHIRQLQPSEKMYICSDGRGLYLEVAPSGSKLWRFKYRFLGKQKRLALGRYPDVGIAAARRAMEDARRMLAAGDDPLAARKQKKLLAVFNASNTLEDIAIEFIEKMAEEGKAERTLSKARWMLTLMKPILPRPVASIKPLEMFAVLKPIEKDGKRETACRCRSFAGQVFRYAIATGRSETDPAAALRGALVTPKVTHHAALLDPALIGKLLRDIDTYSGSALDVLPWNVTDFE